ncbi:hypothetical protein [Streptomyces triticirhizae]|uniref:Uncharacterized protein n=1 Tax=Streptomyces triticirhizae TaxID=2483353 RepID=A0A3M2LFB7_9ACTN|nr:hypothetical protein [Streptomyces triticirhizae]RMI36217.1 hypothetical protein EBN88_22120 [Streptomyces triticirhizae]
MATSSGPAARALAYLESRKNLTGCVCGLVGLVTVFTGLAGAYWPVVVAGLYGAGALIAPPERAAPPPFAGTGGPGTELDAVRADFAVLRDHVAGLDVPAEATVPAAELDELLAALLEPGWVAEEVSADPEAVHILGRAVRTDIPEAFDAYQRTRWWARFQPGSDPAGRHLGRQLELLRGELATVAELVRDSLERRQRTHTTYLESRSGDRETPPEGLGDGRAPG